ncbi:hypothetical protein GZH47_25520 [Paenibacillus rhizovicinus]|uniref:SLH domain-containing protein n=1 Tax=Paenibacillus rhizovicinus TaxID=2704463 RepID=A0A6C0P5U2_9BACL|nr:hypothetical protein [Paenibacillus rhizovicinus]QHW33825.1 hypothetical protein GZH47_25520 [Paenibacillus rhizovicinus]
MKSCSKLIVSLLIVTSIFIPSSLVSANPEQQTKEETNLEKRIMSPETPIDIFDASVSPRPFPSKRVSPQEIIRAGQKLPYKVLLTKPDWVRPVYKSDWHSTVSGGRWSYVPTRLKFAQHRLFTAPAAALSNLYDFLHDTGLFDEPFEILEGKGISQKERLNQVLIVVMQASVESHLLTVERLAIF